MQFYKIEMTINTKGGEAVDTPKDRVGRRLANKDLDNAISVICGRFSEKILDKGYFFISDASYGEFVFGLVLRDYLNIDDFVESFVKKGKLEVENIEIRETTLHEFAQLLSCGERNSYVHDEYEILREFELEDLVHTGPRGMRLDFEERILRERNYGTVNPDDDRADGSLYFLEELCKIIRRHCCDVLTIIQLPRECTALRMKIFETIGDCTFVEIKEELAVDKTAITYLKERARDRGVRTDKGLMARVEKGHGYLVPELNAIFDEWYSKKLKTTVYSQYRNIAEAKTEVKDSKPKGSAYEELESMIGLIPNSG